VDLSGVPASAKSALEAAATELQASLNLSQGPWYEWLFNLGVDKTSRLLLVIHHLVVDGVSWRILVEDLQTTYQQLERGAMLPSKRPRSSSGQSNCGVCVSGGVDYWQRQPFPICQWTILGANTVASARITDTECCRNQSP